MATDLEPILTESLRARAGHDIDPAPIMQAAVVKGARIRRRRRVATAAVAVVAVLGLAAVAVRLPRADTDPPVVPLLAEPALRLPSADGQPGAAARPDLVGADPAVLHFNVDGASPREHATSPGGAGNGTEQVDILAGDRRVFIGLARTADALPGPVCFRRSTTRSAPAVAAEIGGRPGTVRSTERTPAGRRMGWGSGWCSGSRRTGSGPLPMSGRRLGMTRWRWPPPCASTPPGAARCRSG